jgi:hypothetical protein
VVRGQTLFKRSSKADRDRIGNLLDFDPIGLNRIKVQNFV